MIIESRKLWIAIFFAVQLGTALLIISKNIVWIESSYCLQRDEKEYRALLEEKKVLLQKIHELQAYDDLKKYAQDHLAMDLVHRSKIKRITIRS